MHTQALRYAVGLALAVALTGACTTSPAAGSDPGAGSTGPGESTTTTATGAPTSRASQTAYPTSGGPTSAAATPPDRAACVSEAYNGLSQAQRWGQLFMVGIQPAAAPAGIDAVLRSTSVGSVIYLGGWTGAATVAATSQHLQQVTTGRVDLFIAADQEGGAVQQLKGKGFTVLPAALDQGKRSAGELTALGSTLARELREVGVNVNLAPVADTVPPTMTETNAPIGKYRREFGTDPAVVGAAVPPLVSALQNGGVVATVKHFPGLGRITGNTDVTAVGITDSVAAVDDPYLEPFQAGIDAQVGMVMVSSARYPRLDDASPAMFSKAIITGLLRGKLGFDGVVITDDVGAAKAVAGVPVPDRAVRFLAAGGDIVLTASASQAPAMLAAVKARAAKDPEFASALDASVRRVLELKARFGLIRCG
jgi:beta-N-acetylhexosaminidase